MFGVPGIHDGQAVQLHRSLVVPGYQQLLQPGTQTLPNLPRDFCSTRQAKVMEIEMRHAAGRSGQWNYIFPITRSGE